MSDTDTYTLTKRVMVNLYNQVSGSVVKHSDVEITKPEAVLSGVTHPEIITPTPNTRVTLVPKPSTTLYGNGKLYYNRILLENVGDVNANPQSTFSIPDDATFPDTEYVALYLGEITESMYTDEIEGAIEWLLANTNMGLYLEIEDTHETIHYQQVALTEDDVTWRGLLISSYEYAQPSSTVRYAGTYRQLYIPMVAKWDSYYCYGSKPILCLTDYYPPIKWVSTDVAPVISGQGPMEVTLVFEQTTSTMAVGLTVNQLVKGVHYTWVGATATNGVVIGDECLIVPAGVTSTVVSIPTIAADITEDIDYDIITQSGLDDDGETITYNRLIFGTYLSPSIP